MAAMATRAAAAARLGGGGGLRAPLVVTAVRGLSQGRLRVKLSSAVGHLSIRGDREYNEDRFRIEDLGNRLFYFGVFDGHNGSGVADFLTYHLHKRISSTSPVPLLQQMREAFLSTEQEILQVAKERSLEGGSTATVALIRDSELVVGHVGDSRAVLCNEGVAIPLTNDHRPNDPEETRRILSLGGKVVGDRLGGALAMSRAFGDIPLRKAGLVATPDVVSWHLDHRDAFLLLATDGVFDSFTNQASIDIVKKIRTPLEAATQLVLRSEETARGAADNTTALVIALSGWGQFSKTDFSSILKHTSAQELFGKKIDLPTNILRDPALSAMERTDIIDQLFAMFDTSGDGRLSKGEVLHGMAVLGHAIGENDLHEIFLVSSADNQISKEDFAKALKASL